MVHIYLFICQSIYQSIYPSILSIYLFTCKPESQFQFFTGRYEEHDFLDLMDFRVGDVVF